MKKVIKDELFAEFIQYLIKIHKITNEPVGKILEHISGANDVYFLTNEQLLELSQDYYEEIK